MKKTLASVPPPDYDPDIPVALAGGARWCDQHQRAECVSPRKHGRGECHGPAIKGTNACRLHCGRKAKEAKARGRATITAWNAAAAVPDVDYRMAVLGVLQMTWLRLAAYSDLLRRQVAVEGDIALPDSVDTSTTKVSGLIGYRYGAAGKEGRIFAQSEEIRALVALESAERDKVVKYAKVAHDMGISDRLTNLAERWGDVVAIRISAMLEELHLTPEQSIRVPALISTHLGAIDVDSIETGQNDHQYR